MTVRFSSGDVLDGVSNMQRDAELLDAIFEHGVAARVYSWSEPWITLGKFQNPQTDLLPECPVPYAVRPTGGRAVLHGHDITIGLAISLRVLAEGDSDLAAKMSRSVRFAYRGAVRPIVNTLRKCDVDAVLGEELSGLTAGPKSADCFAHHSANDVLDRRTLKKVCGVAMLLTQNAVLVQASIPIEAPKIEPNLVYLKPSAPNWLELDRLEFCRKFEKALGDFGATELEFREA